VCEGVDFEWTDTHQGTSNEAGREKGLFSRGRQAGASALMGRGEWGGSRPSSAYRGPVSVFGGVDAVRPIMHHGAYAGSGSLLEAVSRNNTTGSCYVTCTVWE
jgi:hypothetical protein